MRPHSRMLRVTGGLAAGALTLLLAAPAAPAAPGSRPGATPVDTAELRADLRALVTGGGTASLAEVRDGSTSWRGTAGTANVTTGEPVRADSRFRIGSATKLITATVLLQLVGERRLDLDDPVERRLPGVLPAGSTITVRQLLDHTSGLYDYTQLPEFAHDLLDPKELHTWLTTDRWQTWPAAELVRRALAHGPYPGAPGEFHYSSTNYLIAGMLIERLTGHTYAHEVEHRILRPVGMTDTSLPGTAATIPGPHTHGYVLSGSTYVDVTEMNMSLAGAAGEIISTTTDLIRFNRALLTGRLLHPAQLNEMRKTNISEPGHGYGLGIDRWTLSCGDVWGQGGASVGYRAAVYSTPDAKRTISVSFNPTHDGPTPAQGKAVTDTLEHTFCAPK
ncbi:serine hydrolase domain-containing protein [Embleya sp. AB8]|uniref:serine hydrolase domain-containing protein n=1 Tax=Embleya sp. AB8 TaxID=3156304 RepID=UPI003C781A0C